MKRSGGPPVEICPLLNTHFPVLATLLISRLTPTPPPFIEPSLALLPLTHPPTLLPKLVIRISSFEFSPQSLTRPSQSSGTRNTRTARRDHASRPARGYV